MFKAGYSEEDTPIKDKQINLFTQDEVETLEGWKLVSTLKTGDSVITSTGLQTITNIQKFEDSVTLTLVMLHSRESDANE